MDAIIVEDEINAAESLGALIRENCPQLNVTAIATSPEKGIELIRSRRPGVIFLDIQMPGMGGFELLDKVKDVPLQVIFTTAYDHYAVKAFRHNAVDYLLKPVIVSELVTAVEKLAGRQVSGDSIDIAKLLQKLGGLHGSMRIAVPSINEIVYVETSCIMRLESDSNYTNIILQDGKRLNSTKTLKEFEAMLDPGVFFRVFKTYIVNLNQVGKYIKSDGGYIVMNDGTEIPVSREKRQLPLEKLTSR